jgi:hypothetical protein
VRSARVTAAIAGMAVLAASVWLGWVDASRTLDLLTGRAVTGATAFALAGAVCWLIVAMVAGAVVASLLAGGGRRSLHRASSALLAGATVLALGVAHHNAGYGVCCGNPATAQQAEHRVR